MCMREHERVRVSVHVRVCVCVCVCVCVWCLVEGEDPQARFPEIKIEKIWRVV